MSKRPGASDLLILIREQMAAELHEDLASSIMFSALDELSGEAPETIEALETFVDGPLWKTMMRRVPLDVAASLHVQIARLVHVGPSESWEEESEVTGRMRFVGTAPVPVTIGASSTRFSKLLRTALGPMAVQTTVAGDAGSLRRAVESGGPALVILDCREPPRGSLVNVAEALRFMPRNAVAVLWGSEVEFGQRLAGALSPTPIHYVTLDSQDGVSGLFDLVASRRGPG